MLKLLSHLFLMILLLAFNSGMLRAQGENGNILNHNGKNEIKGQTYIITDNSNVTDLQSYIDALDSSVMNNHRLKNKRNTIIFKTGVKVELFSALEISKLGFPIILSDFPESFEATRQEPVFVLGRDNFIIEYHIASAKHH